jgi:hypothetical protein
VIVKSLALVADGDVGAMGERHPRAPFDVNRRDLEETTENLVIMPVVFRLEIRAARKHEVRTGPGALIALVSHGSAARDTGVLGFSVRCTRAQPAHDPDSDPDLHRNFPA